MVEIIVDFKKKSFGKVTGEVQGRIRNWRLLISGVLRCSDSWRGEQQQERAFSY